VILAPFVVGAIGMVVEVLLIQRLYGKEPLFGLIMTFAIALLIEAVIRVIWGSSGQPFTPPAFLSGFVEYGPILLTKYRLAVLLVTIALLLLLWAFLQFTPYGRILRAGGRDPEMVSLLGINLQRVFTGVFGLGTFFAGIAGLLAGPLWSVTPTMSEAAIMPAFVTVTIGGPGSYLGAVVAGLAIGVVTALTIQFWPEASAASMYVLMAVVLILRPRGLFGERWERFE
jgi:branched-chain amino acid transport system permease protein